MSANRAPASPLPQRSTAGGRVSRPAGPETNFGGISLLAAMRSPALFAPWFGNLRTWSVWLVFLKCLFGEKLTKADLVIYRQCTGRKTAPQSGFVEAALVCGRRSGKSLTLALIAVYLACFRSWQQYLSPGERGVVMIIAADKKQARVIYRYVRAFLTRVPALSLLIERETAEAIDLKNGITIEILAANFRTLRGYSVAAALCDETAFWRTDESGSNPDTEILASIRPAMATIPGAMLLLASSPYAKRGALWQMHRRYHGKNDAPVLVWQAATRTMNPTVPQSVIDEAHERDPASAAAEFGAEFRTDVSGFLERALVDAAVDAGVVVRPPVEGVTYRGHVDASGGVRDSFTCAIAHREADGVILDCLYERRAPLNPAAITVEVAALLASYRITDFEADRYSAQWAVQAFAREGRILRHSSRDRSAIFMDVLPLLTSGQARLLDGPFGLRCAAQLAGLERKTSPAGRDRIEPGPLHDDLAVAAAGALVAAAQQREAEVPICGPILLTGAAPPHDPLLGGFDRMRAADWEYPWHHHR